MWGRSGQIAAATLVLSLAGCLPRASGYRCETDADCVLGGRPGTCEQIGYCSFPDPSCADGRRFGDLSSSYSKQCVGAGDDGDGVTTTGDDAGADAGGDGGGGSDGGTSNDAPIALRRVGGTVSGLTGAGLELQNNGGDDLSVSANGAFQFATPLAQGASYVVTLKSSPVGQTCGLSGASGVVGASDVTSVSVTCTTSSSSDPGVSCNTSLFCTAGVQLCCADKTTGRGSCLAVADAGTCTGKPIYCDSAADCGGAGAVCCAEYSGSFKRAECRASASACVSDTSTTVEVWCDPMAPSPCPGTKFCTGTSAIGPFHTCQ